MSLLAAVIYFDLILNLRGNSVLRSMYYAATLILELNHLTSLFLKVYL